MRQLILAISLGVLMVAMTSVSSASPQPQRVKIVLTEYWFTPNTLAVRGGVPVELVLVNKGKMQHEVQFYAVPKTLPHDWDEYASANTLFRGMGEIKVAYEGVGAVASTAMFEIAIEPGKTATVLFTPTQKGVFEIGCHQAGHYEAGMKGKFIVN